MTSPTQNQTSNHTLRCDHCGEVTLILTNWPDKEVASCNCWCHLYRKGEWPPGEPKPKRKTRKR